MVQHELQIQIYFFPQSLLLFKIQRTLENQVSKHLLDTSPLNIAFNLVPSQAQWPHSVGIVPEILKMTCDGKRFRVFQIYSGEFSIWNDFSKQKIKQESDHVWTFGMAGWSCHPVHWCINRCTSTTHYTTYTGSLFLLQSYLSDELNTVRTSTTRKPSQGSEGYQHWGEIAKNECWPMQYTAINST